MTSDDLSEIRRRALKFGAANCWTGESGRMAVDVFTLLDELERLEKELDTTHTAGVMLAELFTQS